ncbi:arsenic metallochaperone ArsD family protein [Lysinibacillus contaminans]|uniref:arsenic metallochaperone ArsD family protein n=1 Tax=Lysinibacillus contaminans TaxID=1293441 RepID=UPI000A6AFC75|nr:arsenic metallochaperone ArsD family protein [Lysinibacillus contaminans]
MSEGMDALPATFVDFGLLCKGKYPTNEQFSHWSGLSEEELVQKPKVRLSLKGDRNHGTLYKKSISRYTFSLFHRERGVDLQKDGFQPEVVN